MLVLVHDKVQNSRGTKVKIKEVRTQSAPNDIIHQVIHVQVSLHQKTIAVASNHEAQRDLQKLDILLDEPRLGTCLPV